MTRSDDMDRVPVNRAFKFRAYPTPLQQGRVVRPLAGHCDLYNAALMERREAWRARRVSVSCGMQSAQLKDIRKAGPERQGRHSLTARQQTLRRPDTVFAVFFDRLRAANKAGEKQPGYPRFKPYQRFSQVSSVPRGGAKRQPSGSGKWAYATFQAVGTIKVRHHCGCRRARPQQKIVICPAHGVIDADVNGACNIASRAGLGSGQAPTAA